MIQQTEVQRLLPVFHGMVSRISWRMQETGLEMGRMRSV